MRRSAPLSTRELSALRLRTGSGFGFSGGSWEIISPGQPARSFPSPEATPDRRLGFTTLGRFDHGIPGSLGMPFMMKLVLPVYGRALLVCEFPG